MKFATINGFVAILAVSFLVLFTQCKTMDIKDPAQMISISWGDGGGFAGIETRYSLREDGQLEVGVSQEGTSFIKTVSKEETTQLFKTAEVLGLADFRYMIPGNLYNFLEIGVGNDVNRISWNPDKGSSLPRNYIVFHRNLMHLTQSSK